MFIAISTVIVILLGIGVYFRKNRKLHVPMMISAFVLDISLVLAIELKRSAIATTIDQATHTHNPFVLFHIGVSVLVILLYLALMYTGSKVMKLAPIGAGELKTTMHVIHSKLAYAFIALRLINYITSFSMVDKVHL